MSEADMIITPCGSECMSYLIEGDWACMNCLDQLEQADLKAEAEFFANMGEIQ